MLELNLNKPSEIVKRLCERLRTERLALQMTQADVAGRAGIGTNTVSNLEAGRNVGFENVVRVAMVFGRIKELDGLFLPKLDSLDDIRRYEVSAKRHRAKRKHSKEIDELFSPKLDSLDDIRRYEISAKRHRAKRKPSDA